MQGVVVPPRETPASVNGATANGSAAAQLRSIAPANPARVELAHHVPPPAALPRAPEGLIALQSWECVVIAVDDENFTARAVDVSSQHADEEFEFSKEELPPFELDMLEEGAIFYWTIGYRQKLPRGMRERVSRMRFRRLPAWSQTDISDAASRASDLRKSLGWG